MKNEHTSSGEAGYWSESMKAVGTFVTIGNYMRFIIPFVIVPIVLFISFSVNSKNGEAMMNDIAVLNKPLPDTIQILSGDSSGALKTVEIENYSDNSYYTFMSCPRLTADQDSRKIIDSIARGGGLPDPKRYGTPGFFSPVLAMSVRDQGELEVAGKKMLYLIGEMRPDPGSTSPSTSTSAGTAKQTQEIPIQVFFGAVDVGSGSSSALKFLRIERHGSQALNLKDAQMATGLIRSI